MMRPMVWRFSSRLRSVLFGSSYDERSAMFRSQRISTPFLLLLTIATLALVAASGRGVRAVTGPALSINAGADQHAISPLIYGMNFAEAGLAQDVRLTVDRWGGNSTTRYNWPND